MSSLNFGPLGSDEIDEALRHLEDAPEKSLQLCNKVLEENPHNHMGWVVKFLAHRRLGDHNGALNAAQKTTEFDNSTGAHTDVAKGHYQLKNYEDAIQSARKAISLDVNKTAGRSPYCVAALSCAHNGDLLKAFDYADQADAAYPGKWDLVYGTPNVHSKNEFKDRLADIAADIGSLV